MAIRTKTQQTETVETTEVAEETTPVQTETVEQATGQTEPTGVQVMRASLRAAGFKRCPTHDHYMNCLPDEFGKPVEGQTDPAIRPLDEFTGHFSACKQCAKLRSADKRSDHRAASGKPAHNVAPLVAPMHKQDEIDARVKAVRTTLSEDELDQVEALYHDAQ
jgi:hypothetical protein